MKKLSLLFLALLTFWLPTAKAQQTLTVADGTKTSVYVPAYGYYNDGPTKSQFIIEANLLEDIGVGGVISQLQFYISSGSNLSGHYDIYLSETSYSQFQTTNFIDITSAINVCSVESLTFSSNILTIPFTTNYTYNGGNLLVTFNHGTSGSNCPNVYYRGIEPSTYTSINGTNYGNPGLPTSGNQRKFLPKTTITFTPGQVGCLKPKNLTAGNITAESATLSWVSDASNFVVAYGTDTDPDRMTTTNANTTSKTITGLAASTTYNFYVKADCGGGDQSDWSSMATFTTPCQATIDATHPISQDFESGIGCWTEVAGNESNINSYYGIKQGTDHTTGTGHYYSMNSYSYDGEDSQYLISPELSSTSALEMSFWYKFGSSNGEDNDRLFVSYSTTTSDLSSMGTWTEMSFKTDWTPQEMTFPANTKYIAFKYTGTWGYYVYLDDIDIHVAASCAKPTDVDANNITTHTADITWTSDASSFVVAYGTGIDPDQMATVNANTNSATLNGLTANTEYNVYVKAICSASDQSDWSLMATFRTECEALSTLPYTTGFEASEGVVVGSYPNYQDFIPCWNTINDGSSSTQYPYAYNSNPHSGSNVLYFYQPSTNKIANEIAILPEVNTTIYPLNTLRLKFWAKKSYSSAATMIIGAMTDPADKTTFSQIDEVTLNENYTEYTVNLSGYTGTGAYVALKFPNTITSYNYVYVDDVTLELAPTCIEPSGVTYSNVTAFTADISWTKGAEAQNNFVVAYGTGTNTDEMATVNASTNSVTLEGLEPETTYHVYVKAICSATDESAWSNVCTFTTDIACHAPTGLTASNIDATSATMTWTSGAGNYTVQYKVATATDWTEVDNITAETYEIVGLNGTTNYQCRVKANCDNGYSVNGQARSTSPLLLIAAKVSKIKVAS